MKILWKPGFVEDMTQTWIQKTKTKPQIGAVVAAGLLLFGTGGKLRIGNGHASVFLPLWFYDVSAKFNFVLNWMIGATTFCLNALPLQTCPDWNTDPSLSPEALTQSQEALDAKELERMKSSILTDSSGWMKEQHLFQLFDSLSPASPHMLRGKAFRGRVLRCGRFLDIADLAVVQPLRMFGVKWGKRYRSHYVGDPLVFSLFGRFHVPIPIWGNVGMHGIEYRGRMHATMAYDHQPWHDMFVVLDDGVESGRMKFLGLWCHRQKSGGWFTLTETSDIDVTI